MKIVHNVDNITQRTKSLVLMSEEFSDERFLQLLSIVLLNRQPGLIQVALGSEEEEPVGLSYSNAKRSGIESEG